MVDGPNQESTWMTTARRQAEAMGITLSEAERAMLAQEVASIRRLVAQVWAFPLADPAAGWRGDEA